MIYAVFVWFNQQTWGFEPTKLVQYGAVGYKWEYSGSIMGITGMNHMLEYDEYGSSH